MYDAAASGTVPRGSHDPEGRETAGGMPEKAVTEPQGSAGGPLTVLAAGAAAVARSADLDHALAVLLEAASAALAAPVAVVFGQDPDRGAPELLAARGLAPAELDALAGQVVADPAHPIRTTCEERQGAFGRAVTWPGGATMVAADLALVVSRDGIEHGVGALTVAWPADHEIGPAEVELLLALADLAATAVDRYRAAALAAERADWLERMAHTDPLTGLSNGRTLGRVLLLELERARRQGSPVTVVVFDIDGMGALNADAGTPAGDQALREVAAALATTVRLVDTIARTGGDEFTLLAPGASGTPVAQRVLDAVATLPEIAGRRVTVSAGVAVFPADGTDADGLLAAARDALAQARAAGAPVAQALPAPTE